MAIITTVLYETGGDLRIMSAAQLNEIRYLAAWFYQQNPTETLTYVASGGTLSPTMTDRRYQAGAYVTQTSAEGGFASEAATPDIIAIDTTYDKISRTRVSSSGIPGEPNENAFNTGFPIYWDPANKTIRAMTKQDFFDTFIGYTITNGLVGTGSVNKLAAGTYTILTNSTSISGNPGTSIVSTNPIFTDTKANAAAYTAAGIPETQDQPTTINNYYLHKIVQSSKPTYQTPLFVRSTGDGVQVYTTATFESMVEDYTLSAAFGKAGYSVTYEMGTSVSNQKGTNVNDTYLSGSSASGYNQYLAGVDDYRTQEFPNGTTAILNSYKLGIGTGSSYTATADVSTVNEGGTVTFTLSTVNVTPGNIAYAITGIDASDLSAGSLTGNVTTTGTFGSASGTVVVTVAADSTTEGTETMTFTAGGSQVSVTINDTSINSFELVSLEGTSASPETNGVPSLSDGSLEIGWRFLTDGTVQDFDADRAPSNVSTNHIPWVNTTTPATTYYIRFNTAPGSNAPGSAGAGSTTLNTWTQLNAARSVYWVDNRSSASYGVASYTWKVEISSSSTGSDVVTPSPSTFSFVGSPPYTKALIEQVSANNWRMKLWWGGDLVFEQDGYSDAASVPTTVTGTDGFTYTRSSTPQSGNDYPVRQTIPGILATGYYRIQWEGGA